jgi:hypothetical protein
MRDHIASILLEFGLHPATLRVSGRALLWVGGVLAGLGFILRRLDRVELRSGVSLQGAADALPWWLVALAPQSLLGWLLVGGIFLLGWALKSSGDRIERIYGA